ncbi:CCCH RNA binding domain-containing protein [Cryptosporidium canis]|uniref:CCCH RNA binding domain-containing protein n=1 Tax=Cryptosporidium canis TaxID=195482 RepID=A0A9D5DLA2_9CRYT|nr:CCCH RNA binding domain-containing protein [Cryptosporidium canis]
MPKNTKSGDATVRKRVFKKLNLRSDSKINGLQICTFYVRGRCKNGDSCHFLHSVVPLTKKRLCWYFIAGKCSKIDCQFSHEISKFPCRYLNTIGFCRNLKDCRFSHELIKTEEEREEFVRENKDYLLLPHKDGGPNVVDSSHMWWLPLLNKIVKEDKELAAKKSFVRGLYNESEAYIPKGICSSIELSNSKYTSNGSENICEKSVPRENC